MHVAIVMDGNGRWAVDKGRPRVFGHKRGASRVTEIVKCSPKLGIKILTLYAFSTENWKRSAHEVESLMRIFRGYLQSKYVSLIENNVSVRFIGDPSPISEDIQLQMSNLQKDSRSNTGLYLNIAINYGSRDEIIRTTKSIIRHFRENSLCSDDLNENLFSNFLDTQGFPDPDLVIRTANEKRLSNFLLWQTAYSEFYFSSLNWPDFYPKDLKIAIESYKFRVRTFGTNKKVTSN